VELALVGEHVRLVVGVASAERFRIGMCTVPSFVMTRASTDGFS
jgi:hypothetical protein